MYNISDYLNYYGNDSIDKVAWNRLDNLMCAILVYLPIKSFEGVKTTAEFVDYVEINRKKLTRTDDMAFVSYEVFDIFKKSNRYSNLKFYNFVNSRNRNLQFGALTVRSPKDTIICYKGTDHSIIGWIENFRIAYEYPTLTHKMAIDYFNNNIKVLRDQNIYVVGHSKGGNLAMVSAMEASEKVFKKIKKVYNFDGPGFRKDEFNSNKYRRLSGKLENIIPVRSVVGVLLYNKDYTVVNSNIISKSEHQPTSWEVFGEYFVEDDLSIVSQKLHESTTLGIDNLEYDKIEEVFETIFENLEIDYSSDIDIPMDKIIKFLFNMKNVDDDVKDGIINIFQSMLGVNFSLKRDNK